jgi:probable phosphoglycerate mutase
MQLLLIRHGRPVRAEVEHGPADPQLSEIGLAQAHAMAAWLAGERVDSIYASPMRRARETATPLSVVTGAPITVEDGIAEYDREASEYIPIEELKAAGDDRWREIPEGIDEFSETVIATIEGIVERHPHQRVALVCHGGVINVYVAHILGIDRPMFFLPGYTSISRVWAASSGERSVESLNELSHLRDLGREHP